MTTRTPADGTETAPAGSPTPFRTVIGIERPRPGPGTLPEAGGGSDGLGGASGAGVLGLLAGALMLGGIALAMRRQR